MAKKDGSVHRIWYDEPTLWASEQDSRVDKECKFLDKLFKKYKVKKILDVGCGAGSHCIKLKNLGYFPVGVDLNKKLIQYAKKKSPEIDFSVADQKNLGFNKEFDAVYTLCTVIAYAITNEDLVKTLKNHYRALKKNGLLIIDTFNPIIFIDKAEYEHERKNKENALGLYAIRKYSVDENKQLSIDEATFYNAKTNKKVSSDKSVKRMTFPQEMRFFLEQTGFSVLDFYGDFDFKHKKLDSHRMIVIAQKKKF
ncbi:MAG: class I SAM-dependent methyltransferase [Nanoarchaeota archaeon]|nr:class I SAM-dependent methyltransferase [Nanoarchaeota archaeon]